MTDHDPMCPSIATGLPSLGGCQCGLIARVRADEQERRQPPIVLNMVEEVERAADREASALAELRAKVGGLPYRTWVPPHAMGCPGRPGKHWICTCGDSLLASDWMLRSDILALIDEALR